MISKENKQLLDEFVKAVMAKGEALNLNKVQMKDLYNAAESVFFFNIDQFKPGQAITNQVVNYYWGAMIN